MATHARACQQLNSQKVRANLACVRFVAAISCENNSRPCRLLQHPLEDGKSPAEHWELTPTSRRPPTTSEVASCSLQGGSVRKGELKSNFIRKALWFGVSSSPFLAEHPCMIRMIALRPSAQIANRVVMSDGEEQSIGEQLDQIRAQRRHRPSLGPARKLLQAT